MAQKYFGCLSISKLKDGKSVYIPFYELITFKVGFTAWGALIAWSVKLVEMSEEHCEKCN